MPHIQKLANGLILGCYLCPYPSLTSWSSKLVGLEWLHQILSIWLTSWPSDAKLPEFLKAWLMVQSIVDCHACSIVCSFHPKHLNRISNDGLEWQSKYLLWCRNLHWQPSHYCILCVWALQTLQETRQCCATNDSRVATADILCKFFMNKVVIRVA